MSSEPQDSEPQLRKTALKFILFMGFVSLFADITYEGARSIIGPYLAFLGASAAVVGFVSGFGELIGYGLRYVSGIISDKTGKYWAMTIAGYGINLVAVPLMALAGSWEMAALLIIMERMGKAIRSPAKDALLSNATSQVGHGWGFGLHEAMDQIGALTGPLIISTVLFFTGDYRAGFAALGISALIAMVIVFAARFTYPDPSSLDRTCSRKEDGVDRRFWLYMGGIMLIAAAYADFSLLSFHFQKEAIAPMPWIPLLYALAMASDAISGLVFGKIFDRIGYRTMAIVTAISLFSPLLLFFGSWSMVMMGVIIWGVGLGAQESIMRAGVAAMTPSGKRGRAFGTFNTLFGVAWFLGSVTMGLLYDFNLTYVVIFSMLLQLISIPVFLSLKSP